MTESVQLVDGEGNLVGVEDKLSAHRSGRLHRAVSVFILRHGELLLQRRASTKYHFGGLWANTCCTHPRPGESPRDAAERRLPEEMGITAVGLEEVGTFLYTAPDPVSGLTEHEYDHVFTGSPVGAPAPDPNEVDEWHWVELEALRRRLRLSPQEYTPWLRPALEIVLGSESGWG